MEQETIPDIRTAHLRLVTSEICNLDCAGCHFNRSSRGKARMSREVASSSMLAFASNAEKLGLHRAELSLYGGEPLLNVPALEEIIEVAHNLRENGEFDFQVILNTNGTRLKSDLVTKLVQENVRVHVSLNGFDEETNWSRRTKSGASTVDMVIAALKMLSSAQCRFQVNILASEQSFAQLEKLLDTVAGVGGNETFLGLPDGCLDWVEPELIARRLLDLDGRAEHLGMRFSGPWKMGLERELPDAPWPPLNIVVSPRGEAYLPHFTEHTFSSVAGVFGPDSGHIVEDLGAQWASILDECGSCDIRARCRGYLKMMVRYHTGDHDLAVKECDVARTYRALAIEDPMYASLRASVDLRVRQVEPNALRMWNALTPEVQLEVSPDVLQVLGWFRLGGSTAGIVKAYEADNLVDVVQMLRDHHLLMPPHQDTDRGLLVSWTQKAEHLRTTPSLVLGALDNESLERLHAMLPALDAALRRLPERLRPRSVGYCVFGVPSEEAMADVIGADARDATLKWLAGTVLHSVVVLNLSMVEGVFAFDGRSKLELLERGLVHEFVHIGLRQRGYRVPLWLEEGFCEYISGRPDDLPTLARAATTLDRFVEFITDGFTRAENPNMSLLWLSKAPVDENPAYALAFDLVRFVLNKAGGLDRLLDELSTWGVAGLYRPFPVGESNLPFLAMGLQGVVDAWTEDLRGRLAQHAGLRPENPYRLIVEEDVAALYHRVVGGNLVFRCDQLEHIEELVGRNLSQRDVGAILDSIPEDNPTRQRWEAGELPDRRIRHLRLGVHSGCNLRCEYCYVDRGSGVAMTVDVADRAVKIWRDLLRPGDEDVASIRFFGGEPLLNWPVISHVLDTVSRAWPGDGPRLILNTNGTLLKDDHVKRLAREGGKLHVGLSIDGIGATHDARRRTSTGRGSFEGVDRAAQALATAEVPLVLVVVLGEHNVGELNEIVDYAARLRDVHDSPVSLLLEPELSPSGYGGTVSDLIGTHLSVIERCRSVGVEVSGKAMVCFDAFVEPTQCFGHYCSVTGGELSVTPAGETIVCWAISDSAYSSLEEIEMLGRVPLSEDVRSRCTPGLDDCTECVVEGLCGGGCMAQSVMLRADTQRAPGDAFCDTVRALFDVQARHYLRERSSRASWVEPWMKDETCIATVNARAGQCIVGRSEHATAPCPACVQTRLDELGNAGDGGIELYTGGVSAEIEEALRAPMVLWVRGEDATTHRALPVPGCTVCRAISEPREGDERLPPSTVLDPLIGITSVGWIEDPELNAGCPDVLCATVSGPVAVPFGEPPLAASGQALSVEGASERQLGEAAERYSALRPDRNSMETTTAVELGSLAPPVERLNRYVPSQLEATPFTALTETTKLAWIRGYSIERREERYVPAAFVYLTRSWNPEEPKLDRMTSTGLAAHLTHERAVEAAALELIERYTMTRAWHSQDLGRSIAIDVLPERSKGFLDRLADVGLEMTLCALSNPVDVPVVLAAVHGERYPWITLGSAARGRLDEAALRAAEEAAAQWQIVARDPRLRTRRPRLNATADALDHVLWYSEERSRALELQRMLCKTERSSPRQPSEISGAEVLTRAIELAGEVIEVTITSVDCAWCGLEVVRLLAPGLPLFSFGALSAPEADLRRHGLQDVGRPHPFG